MDMVSAFRAGSAPPFPPKSEKYIRGPGWDGLDMSIIVDKGYAFVHLGVAAQPQAPILLTGYISPQLAALGMFGGKPSVQVAV
jgi:hypothetical protein